MGLSAKNEIAVGIPVCLLFGEEDKVKKQIWTTLVPSRPEKFLVVLVVSLVLWRSFRRWPAAKS